MLTVTPVSRDTKINPFFDRSRNEPPQQATHCESTEKDRDVNGQSAATDPVGQSELGSDVQ